VEAGGGGEIGRKGATYVMKTKTRARFLKNQKASKRERRGKAHKMEMREVRARKKKSDWILGEKRKKKRKAHERYKKLSVRKKTTGDIQRGPGGKGLGSTESKKPGGDTDQKATIEENRGKTTMPDGTVDKVGVRDRCIGQMKVKMKI